MGEGGRPLTPSVAAQRLGVHRNRIYEWIEEGLLRAHNRSPGKLRPTWVIYEADLDEFDAKSATLVRDAKTTHESSEKVTETPRNSETAERKSSQKVTEACAYS
jgi:excisionase family DNA binding protein